MITLKNAVIFGGTVRRFAGGKGVSSFESVVRSEDEVKEVNYHLSSYTPTQ